MKTMFIPFRFLVLTIFSLLFFKAGATDFYWVGGSGNWSDYSNHWAMSAGGSTFHTRTPSPNDDVFFDTKSFPEAGSVVTVDQTVIYVRNMTWTGVTNNPTFTGTDGQTLRIFGSLAFSATMTYDFWGIVNFEATTTGQTVRTAGQTFLNEISFRGAGGGWTLQDDLSMTDNRGFIALKMMNGTLNTNGKTVSVPVFSALSTATGSLVLGASTINLTQGGWQVDQSSLTINAGTSSIKLLNSPNAIFRSSGHSYYAVSFESIFPNTSGSMMSTNDVFNGPVSFSIARTELVSNNSTFNADVRFQGDGVIGSDGAVFNGPVTFLKKGTFFGSGTFTDLMFTPGYVYTFHSGFTQTLLGHLTATGTGSLPISIQASSPGTPATLLKANGSVCLDYVYLSDINATGGAVFNAGKAPERSLDLGGNPGWIFTGGCSAVVLPVSISTITATCTDNGDEVLLKWQTVSETNQPTLTLEKSTDGSSFYAVTHMQGVGTTRQAGDYSYLDKTVAPEKAFYRLRLSDKDGRVVYSKVVRAAGCKEKAQTAEVYPNPSRGGFFVRLGGRFARVNAALYNSLGRKVYQATEYNSDVLRVNAIALPAGVYFLRVLTNGSRIEKRIVIE